jgi:hypothetical protein
MARRHRRREIRAGAGGAQWRARMTNHGPSSLNTPHEKYVGRNGPAGPARLRLCTQNSAGSAARPRPKYRRPRSAGRLDGYKWTVPASMGIFSNGHVGESPRAQSPSTIVRPRRSRPTVPAGP